MNLFAETTLNEVTIKNLYRQTRQSTLALCEPLGIEDYGLQAMPEVSPPKWHLAHTSWFFETFILKQFDKSYRPLFAVYEYLFNSYYNGVGQQFPRAQRGLLSRPTVDDVLAYRVHVDEAMMKLLDNDHHPDKETIHQRCLLGIHHEQQHQELFCTDIKYSFSFNPLYPSLGKTSGDLLTTQKPLVFHSIEPQSITIGFNGEGYHFDNEIPAHQYQLSGFKFASRLVTNREYQEFIDDKGYQSPELWLADGWSWLQESKIRHPCYWRKRDNAWFEYSLYGLRELHADQPVCHISYYEADAYARWVGKRLPFEQEWEAVSRIKQLKSTQKVISLHPQAADPDQQITQMYDDLWQWTASSYSPYPGYRAAEGAIGEYNGKFMCNQMVLRGSSCVTPPGHSRSSYRNFFYPKDQWQFSGIRLADNL